MKLFLILIFAGAVLSQDIICPLSGNPDPKVVSEADCSVYTACEYTSGSCHMKSNAESGYVVSSAPIATEKGFYITLNKADSSNTLFGADISQLIFEVVNHENYHLQVKIYDAENSRYEVPFPIVYPDVSEADPLYSILVSGEGMPFSFNVTRNSNNNMIFRMAGPLSFEDQFLQITTLLRSSYLYGIGENTKTKLRHEFDQRKTYPIFARDQPIGTEEVNEYGTHPYYVNVEDDEGNTHSVLLYNSNAMEYSTFAMADGTPAVTMRTIGGIIDLHMFLGPTPEDVNEQYAHALGETSFPPYWSLGFHLSRWGYDSTDNYRQVYDRMKAAGIPWDTQIFDIDYMDRFRDFTYDSDKWADFPELIDELHADNMRVILILDPAIVTDFDNYGSAMRGKAKDVFIKWMSKDLVPADQMEGANDYIVGYLWPDAKTVFPDFFNPATIQWWDRELQLLKQTLDYDGIWIDMNEPSNFGTNLARPWNYPSGEPDWSLKCPENSLDSPPYATLAAYSSQSESQRLSDKTICMSTLHTDDLKNFTHYDVHNLYGYTESLATYAALFETIFPQKRHIILSRSTFPGTGRFAIHWLGDNTATWEQLHMSIIGMIEFNMFVMPMVGADVCGYFGEPDEELCIRWMQAGAFYPFDRNHNTNGTADQDPAKPGWDLAPVLSKEVLLLRYKYIPYMYARFHRAHMNGRSVIRPLFNVFPSDLKARDIDDQFFWSEDLMVAPVITKRATTRDVYFPEGLYYDLVSGSLDSVGPETLTVDAPLEKIPVYIRGGSIIPFQEPGLTTKESRLNPFGITVALNEDATASGEVFWDDGENEHVMSETFIGKLDFVKNELTLEVEYDPTPADGLMLETIQFFGVPSTPNGISINGVVTDSSSYTFDDTTGVLILSLSVPLNEPLSVLLN